MQEVAQKKPAKSREEIKEDDDESADSDGSADLLRNVKSDILTENRTRAKNKE
jgi:hypothetical protein